MSQPVPVTAPLNNVNDESVVILEWLKPDGAAVSAGEPVVSFETSKANVEIEAPASGYLKHSTRVGQEVPVGAVLCYIVENADQPIAKAAPEPVQQPPAAQVNTEQSLQRFTPVARKLAQEQGLEAHNFEGTGRIRKEDVLAQAANGTSASALQTEQTWPLVRFSTAAKTLMNQHNLSPDRFTGKGLIRVQDVERFLSPPAAPVTVQNQPISIEHLSALQHSPAAGVPVEKEALPRRKKMEIKNLAAGLSASVTSAVSVACPTRSLKNALRSHPELRGSATALIVYECARLLKQFRVFNGCYIAGEALYYQQVNVGFAIDAGFGLKVPVIPVADSLTIAEIAEEMNKHILAYMEDKLPPESQSGGTFTISDLSSEGVFSLFPLISSGQSAILGVGGEFFASENSEGFFTLTLSFDHQLGDGRQAAKFLNALRDRLTAYEAACTPPPLPGPPNIPAHAPAAAPLWSTEGDLECSRCLRAMPDLQQLSAYLVPTVQSEGKIRLLCSLCLGGF